MRLGSLYGLALAAGERVAARRSRLRSAL